MWAKEKKWEAEKSELQRKKWAVEKKVGSAQNQDLKKREETLVSYEKGEKK